MTYICHSVPGTFSSSVPGTFSSFILPLHFSLWKAISFHSLSAWHQERKIVFLDTNSVIYSSLTFPVFRMVSVNSDDPE